jgi:HAD superfamily phosphoserine phosphatase-like hydrolase
MPAKYSHFSAIIPAYNEGKTVAHVVREVLGCPDLGEVLVVDDGSQDDTKAVLSEFAGDKRFHHIRHEKNKGKGVALRTGLKKAKNEAILFLDADLKNITTRKINRIIKPVLNDEVDLSRARFQRKRGRVTEIAVKPMMRILFPDQSFDQPITGQICGKKSFFETINFNTDWGVDIGILLDAIEAGQRIQEVDIGKLEHKAHTDQELSVMAQQVLETLIRKAGLIQHKYKLIIFTLDDTIIPRDSMQFVLKKLGLSQEMMIIRDGLENGTITYPEYLLAAAELFKRKTIEEIEKACDLIKLEPYTLEVLQALKHRKFNVAIVTPSFSPIVSILAKKLGVTNYDCVELSISKQGAITGQITTRSKQHWLTRDIESAMIESTKRVIRKANVGLPETVIVASTVRALPIFQRVGLGLAYRPKNKELKMTADKTITVLAEVLALVE